MIINFRQRELSFGINIILYLLKFEYTLRVNELRNIVTNYENI